MPFCFLKQTTVLLKWEILDLCLCFPELKKEKKKAYRALNQYINHYWLSAMKCILIC